VLAAVAQGEGEAVFLPHGGNSPYLERIIAVLRGIDEGVRASEAMCAAFQAHELIQPVTMELRFDESHQVNLTGLYGIDREKLAMLDAAALHELHRAGWLEGAFLIQASLFNMRRHIAEKQYRLREQETVTNAGQGG
jgi:hypothetical protein